MVPVSRDLEGTKTWAFTVCGGLGSGRYEHIMYDNGVGVRRAATWLQEAIRIGGGIAPPPPPHPAVARYMDWKIAEYVGRMEHGMLCGRTHVKVEESFGDAQQPHQKRPKKGLVERKGKGRAATLAGGSLDIDALVARLLDAVFHEAFRQAVAGVIKPKGFETKVTRVEADSNILRDKIVQMKGVEQN